MKTKAQGLYHYKANDRWKWMAGATAATAAGVTASQAGTMTVSLGPNDYLSADFTKLTNAIPMSQGGGTMQVTFLGAFKTHTYHERQFSSSGTAKAYVKINGVINSGVVFSSNGRNTFAQARFGASHAGGGGSRSATISGKIPITFTDPSINGGAPTNGLLDVTDTAGPFVEAKVQLVDFTYDTTAIPEPSSLALLAVGAGGVLAFRQRRKALKE